MDHRGCWRACLPGGSGVQFAKCLKLAVSRTPIYRRYIKGDGQKPARERGIFERYSFKEIVHCRYNIHSVLEKLPSAVTGGGSVGECGRLSQPGRFLGAL